jgi:hypothetical protein
MSSELQILANQENGKLGGVKTEAGKAAVRLNAVTHGLLTKEAVVHGESKKMLNELRDNLMKEHQPQGELETMLVEMIATSFWRRCRVVRQETDWLNGDFDQYQCYYAVANGGLHWQNLSRYETMYERQFYKAIHELERVQRSRRGENIPAPLAIDVDLPQQT